MDSILRTHKLGMGGSMIWILLAFMVVVAVLVGAMLDKIEEREPKPKEVSKRRLSQMTILDPEESTVVIINKKPTKGRTNGCI
jgi:beta-lactamase regulating signal transducer with metallopeptidase domain